MKMRGMTKWSVTLAVLATCQVAATEFETLEFGLSEHRMVERSDMSGLARWLDEQPEMANATSYRKGSCSILAYAAKLGHYDVARLLLERGADKEAKCHEARYTPLMLSCLCSMQHEVNHRICPGHLHKENQAIDSHALVAKVLLEHNASIDTTDSEQEQTAVHFAALNGNEEILSLLLSQGASANRKDKHGWTPLLYAIQRGDAASVRLLAQAGVDLNEQDAMGISPIAHAAHHGFTEVVSHLLHYGASYKQRDSMGMFPLDYAASAGHSAVVDLFRSMERDEL